MVSPYVVEFSPPAQAVLSQALPVRRYAIEARLEKLAALAGLRAWVNEVETSEPLPFKAGVYEGNYVLEPGLRRLRVVSLKAKR